MPTPSDNPVESLVSRWCALQSQGQKPTPEQLDDPLATMPPSPVEPASSAPPAPPGYEILGELGRGGMGVVYKARQVGLNRLVALKMILAGGHAGTEERIRFLAEGEVIAAIRHPGIVQIHDFGTHAGLPFFALEFCPGGSLAGKLNGTPLPPREAARIVEQVADAMQAAHERGIIHRDLKPANVLLSFSRDAESSERSARARAAPL